MKITKFILSLVGCIACFAIIGIIAFGGTALIAGAIDTVNFNYGITSNVASHSGSIALGIAFLSFFIKLPASAALNSPVVSNLTAYAGKYMDELIGQIFNFLDIEHLTLYTNIKGKVFFPKMTVAKGLKKYSPSFNPGDDLNYTDRAITPELFKREIRIEPKKFQNTFMEAKIGKGANATAIPFEAFTWKQIISGIAEELNDSVIGTGDVTSADDAQKVLDGFLEQIKDMITANTITPIATGAWSGTNAYLKAEQMFKTLPSKWKKRQTIMYMSVTNGERFVESYRAAFPNDQSVYGEDGTSMFVKNTGKRCKIVPVTWLGDSNRVIIAPRENMVLVTDLLSDQNDIKTIPAMWTVDAGISFMFGVGIPDKDALWVNDQA